MENKNILKIIGVLFLLFFVTGCSQVDLSKVSDSDLERISEKAVVCNEPYIRKGIDCCLDKDNNNICDSDEMVLNNIEDSKNSNLDDSSSSIDDKNSMVENLSEKRNKNKLDIENLNLFKDNGIYYKFFG